MKCVSHKFTLWKTSALKTKMSVRKGCIGVDEWLAIFFEASALLKPIRTNDFKLGILRMIVKSAEKLTLTLSLLV